MRLRWAVAAALGLAALACACGGTAGDLMAIEYLGGPDTRRHQLVLTGDGRAHCGDGRLRPIASELLIEAREVEREVEPLAEDGASFDEEASGRRHYGLRTRAGAVTWVEGRPGLPAVLPRAQLLALRLERELCPGGPARPGA